MRSTLASLWLDLPDSGFAGPVVTAEVFIATPDGPVRVGMDRAGARHLLVPVPGSTRALTDTRSGGVFLTTRDFLEMERPVRFLDLECRRPDLEGVFTGLCADVCQLVAESPLDLPRRVAAMLADWRQLLGQSAARWSRSMVAGLHGELLVLLRLLGLDPSASELWTGPAGAAHDFHSGSDAVEVKTTSSASGRLVHVHGVDQLESPAAGGLTLAWLRVVESAEGSTVLELRDQCLALAADPAVLLGTVGQLGLPADDDPLVAAVRFQLKEERWYAVEKDFPRLTPDVMRDSVVPAGIGQIEYVVDLDVIGHWEETGDRALQALVARS